MLVYKIILEQFKVFKSALNKKETADKFNNLQIPIKEHFIKCIIFPNSIANKHWKEELSIFLNENVNREFNFNDGIPYVYRDMGVDDSFFIKNDKKNIFPIILTHLNPDFYKTYAFRKLKVYYLNELPLPQESEKMIDLLKKRDDIEKNGGDDVISRYMLHFHNDYSNRNR